jgi:thiamine biosynthesis lipoprotein
MSVLIIICLYVFNGCGFDSQKGTGTVSSHEDTGFAMGTVVFQTIYSRDKEISSNIIGLLTDLEIKKLSWRVESSEISVINRNSKEDKPTEVTEETIGYLTHALSIAENSGGAFDPAIGMLTRLWDFDSAKNSVPPKEEIKELLAGADYRNIKLEGNEVRVDKGANIDMGAIGKGIGCDEAKKYLNERDDVECALINLGGSSILTYGTKDTGEPWTIAVIDPREDGHLGYIEITGTKFISTSGDYNRYFIEDGVRYHHILDPHTGYPADSGLMSVTVVSDKGADSDALSTAALVLGKDRALDLLEKYDADGIFVDTNKNIFITERLKDKFILTAKEYKII